MVILISGATHTGKTTLAQRLMERYAYPYLSIDLLKMGLIRSSQTSLTAMSGWEELTAYLWRIVAEIVKTAVENKQDLIIEGCYIPFNWRASFSGEYLPDIRYRCLIMSEEYIRGHFMDIKRYANVIEKRGDDTYCTVDALIRENAMMLSGCRQYGADYIYIDGEYSVDWEL